MDFRLKIIHEYKQLVDLFQNNSTLHSEILNIFIIVLIVGLLVLIMRFELIQKMFSKHEYKDEPIGFKNTWKVYFSAPLLSANGVCMWRIYTAIPLSILLGIYYNDPTISSWLIYIIAFLFATDALDGAIARWLENITNIGKILDPLADKFLVLAILSTTLYHYDNNYFIMTGVLLIIHDVIGQFIRGKAKNPAANWIGKTKTAITMLTTYILSLSRYDLYLDYIAGALLLISFIFTLWSFYGKLSPKMKSRSVKFFVRFIWKKAMS